MADYASDSFAPKVPSATTEITTRRSAYARKVILRRIVAAPLTLLGMSLAIFVVIDLSPNDPAQARLGIFASAEERQVFAEQHGLNDPLPLRFWYFLVDILHLRLGDSLIRSESVGELIKLALPVTLQLMLFSTIIALGISTILGVVAARNEGRLVDRFISSVVAVVQASPSFWLGLLFIQLFAVSLGLLPSGGYTPLELGFNHWFSSLIGPSIVLALPFAAIMTRVIRASMADELAKDYVSTAIGAGVRPSVVLSRNVLRNALITPITVLGVHVGSLMSGALLVEFVFNLPGMGTLLITGVTASDLGLVRGVAIVGATAFIAVNLLVDLTYLLLNPRGVEASNQ